MKPRLPKLILWGVLAWLPYFALRLYWQRLIATAPDSAHGELSGPVQFFLPALLVAAILFSIVLVAGFYFKRPRSAPNLK